MTTDVQVAVADPAVIRQTFDLLIEPGGVVEIRVIVNKSRTISGYYNDPARFVADAVKLNRQYGTTYVTLNPPEPSLLARKANRYKDYSSETTSDKEIARRRWLLIDCDVVRPTGISSSDDEHARALDRILAIAEYLRDQGWLTPVVADSGNGGHLLYPIDLPNDDVSKTLLENCLKALDERFSDDEVKIDCTTFNASRLTKLYGTVAGKGDSTVDRPHRLATILMAPGNPEPVAVHPLEALASAATPERTEPVIKAGGGVDIDRWIADHNLDVLAPVPYLGGRKWVFETCPWNDGHTNRSALIIQFPSGALSASCRHDGCKGKDWHDLRRLYEPERAGGILRMGGQSYGTVTASPSTNGTAGQTVSERRPRFTLHTAEAIKAMPPPTWLIEGVLVENTLAVIVGKEASYKSFNALDMAASVATGTPWQGRAVKQGVVVYVSAEGVGGLGKRIAALEQVRGYTLGDNFRVITEPVQILDDAAIDALIDAIGDLPTPPKLIVFDTQAKCMIGGDENSARDMGKAIDAEDRLRRATGAVVTAIHHENKAGGTRGSTALPGGVDTIIEASADGQEVELRCGKQKDFDGFAPIRLRREVVALDGDETSLVFSVTEGVGTNADAMAAKVGAILSEHFGTDEGATTSQWLGVCMELGIPRRTFFRAKKALWARCEIQNIGAKGRGTRYIFTPGGHIINGKKLAEESEGVKGANLVPTESGTKAPDDLAVGAKGATPRRGGTLALTPKRGRKKNPPSTDQSHAAGAVAACLSLGRRLGFPSREVCSIAFGEGESAWTAALFKANSQSGRLAAVHAELAREEVSA